MRPVIAVLLVCSAAWLTACNSATHAPAEESAQPPKQYKLHGEVVSLDPEGRLAKIHHDDIEGWMKSMTMEYPVKDPADYNRLHPGDCINATVYVQDLKFWLGQIQQTPPTGAGCVAQPK